MPSTQHDSIKALLNKATRPLKEKGLTPTPYHMRHLLEMGTLFFLLPWGVHIKKVNINAHLDGEVLKPNHADNDKVLLYLHGGGYTIGSIHSHRSMVGKICKKAGIISLLPDYRKAPENPFPAALDDAIASYQRLLDRGRKPENIIVGGDSAGGGLALSLLLALRDRKMPLPAAAILLSPWVDLAATGETIKTNYLEDPLVDERKMKIFAKMYAGEYDVTHPYLSPLYADLTGLPPLLIQVSDAEMLYDDSLRLASLARRCNVQVTMQQWSGLIHWWHLFQRLVPEANEAIEKMVVFIQKTFKMQETEQLSVSQLNS